MKETLFAALMAALVCMATPSTASSFSLENIESVAILINNDGRNYQDCHLGGGISGIIAFSASWPFCDGSSWINVNCLLKITEDERASLYCWTRDNRLPAVYGTLRPLADLKMKSDGNILFEPPEEYFVQWDGSPNKQLEEMKLLREYGFGYYENRH